MGLLLWSMVGGFVGTALMDITDSFAERLKFTISHLLYGLGLGIVLNIASPPSAF